MLDAHLHHWKIRRGDYGWLTPHLGAIYRDFGPQEYAPLRDRTGVKKAILVQAAPTISETRYLLNIAGKNDYVAGVVGWVDFESPSALSDLASFTKHPKFVGVRPMIQDIPENYWMLSPAFDEIFHYLHAENLCFDALILPKHLPNLALLAKKHPELKIVINHGAKPEIRNRNIDSWKEGIAACAASSNVYCKLSGLLTEAEENTEAPDLAPYVEHLIRCFGPQRLMWGSDWPVVNLASDYLGWANMAHVLTAKLSDADQEKVFQSTAEQFYGVAP